MNSGGCSICVGKGCAGKDSETLSTLDIRTYPSDGKCNVTNSNGIDGQKVEIDSVKDRDIDIAVKIIVNNPALSVKGASRKEASVPGGSTGNTVCFDLKPATGASRQQAAVEIECELLRGKNRPSSHLKTFTVKRNLSHNP